MSTAFSPIRYDADKSKSRLDENREIGARKLTIRPEAVVITLAAKVFAE